MRADGDVSTSSVMCDEDEVQGIVAKLTSSEPVRVRVWGRSMLPFVWPGATVAIEPLGASPLRTGEVVLVRKGATVALHRVVDAHRGVTQGDWFEHPDSPSPIIGRLARPVLGLWEMPRVLRSPADRMALALAPRVRFAWSRHRRLARSAERTVSGNGILKGLRRALWSPRVTPLQPQHGVMIKPYLLRRGRRPVRATLDAWEAAAHGDADRFVTVVVVADRICGSVVATRQVGGADFMALDLWIDRSLRGLGLSHALIEALTEEADRRGVTLRAHVRRDNLGAWRAFESAGFRSTGALMDASPTHREFVRLQERPA